MKISNVVATCHDVPVELPLGKKTSINFMFVKVETDEGITGYGITEGRMRFPTREYVNRHLKPFLVGKNPIETEKIWNRDAYAELGMPPTMLAVTDLVRWGFSAVDIALWDIKGKYFNQPVFRLLGGASNRIGAYVTFGLHLYSREELATAARHFMEMGQNKLKMQVSYTKGPDIDEEVARIRTVREAMGDEGMLMLDANDRFTFLQAKELLKRIEGYNITWLESPLAMNTDLKQMRELRRHSTVTIGHSGGLPGRRWFYRDLMNSGAVDIIMPNVIHVGGYTEAVKIANMAQAFNLPLATGAGQPHHNMHLIAGVANGWMVEFHYGHTLRDEIIFNKPVRFDRGFVTIPEKPGLGLEVNEAALKEFEEK